MFVVYNKETTIYMPEAYNRRYGSHTYATEGAAKAALTRAYNDERVNNKDDYAIAEYFDFAENIEKKVVKKNLLSGKDMPPMSVNTPACVDPSTETYHCM